MFYASKAANLWADVATMNPIPTTVGSVIARLGSKRLPYKNLLPFRGVPLVRRGVLKLLEAKSIDKVVLSTESELIARQVEDLDVIILKRPDSLSGDNVPSVPVFQHIVENVPCDRHLNYNINFPNTEVDAIDGAIQRLNQSERGEVLSSPYAIWAQTALCLRNYEDPWKIRADVYEESRVLEPDIHTESDLLENHNRGTPFAKNWWTID